MINNSQEEISVLHMLHLHIILQQAGVLLAFSFHFVANFSF